jgi:mRNA export factor
MATGWGPFSDASKAATTPKSNQDGDMQVQNAPSDGISCLALNGSATTPSTILTVGSWDSTLSCYEMQNLNTNLSGVVAQSQLKHDAPVLCTSLGADGMTSYSAGCDGIIKSWNVTQPATSAQNIGKHDAPVRHMNYIPEMSVLITGSWDRYNIVLYYLRVYIMCL